MLGRSAKGACKKLEGQRKGAKRSAKGTYQISLHVSEVKETAGAAAPTAMQWALFSSFVVVLAFLGGSSRADVAHNVLLRPLVALLVLPAAFSLRSADFKRGKAVLVLMVLALLWIISQLIPLPPTVWQALPGRIIIAEIDRLAGHANMWRSVSLAPLRGLDAVLAMTVPFGALFLALWAKASRSALLFALAASGIINATIGLLQFLGGSSSLFYLFAGADPGAVEGIFGNENHSAVFSAVSLLVIGRLMLEAPSVGVSPWRRLLLAPGFAINLLAILISGSRAGLFAALAALLASALMWSVASRHHARPPEGAENERSLKRGGRAALLVFAAATLMVVFAFIWLERAPAFEGMVQRNAFEDLRWALWPVLHEMAATHWLFGTGFGSFEAVYRLYEPTELLMPAYVNHAHNDWAQLVIEGGLPAVMILAGLVWWIVRAIVDLVRDAHAGKERMIFWSALVMIIAAASLVDYPLRTPTFQATVVWLLLCLSSDRASARNR